MGATTSYYTRANGGFLPYRVSVESDKVTVYGSPQRVFFYKGDVHGNEHTKKLHTFPLEHATVMLPSDMSLGNSLILVSSRKVIYIGDEILEFPLPDGDVVQGYYSELVGDAPNPVVVGSKNVYFPANRKYISRDVIVGDMTEANWATIYDAYIHGLDKTAMAIKKIRVIK